MTANLYFTANQCYMTVFSRITFHIKFCSQNLSLQIICLYDKRLCVFCNFKVRFSFKKNRTFLFYKSGRINQFTIGIQPNLRTITKNQFECLASRNDNRMSLQHFFYYRNGSLCQIGIIKSSPFFHLFVFFFRLIVQKELLTVI